MLEAAGSRRSRGVTLIHGLVSGTLVAASWLSIPASAQVTQTEPLGVVITAQTRSATSRDLAACLLRRCPPDEDVAATLRHADILVLDGDYRGARAVLRAAIGRNRSSARAYPVPLSALYRGAATVDLHLGESTGYILNTVKTRDALRSALPHEDARLLMAQLEVGDMRARLGYAQEAERHYRGVADAAEEGGHPLVAAAATIRLAWLFSTRADVGDMGADELRSKARDLMTTLLASPTAARDRRVRLGALGVLVATATGSEQAGAATALVRKASLQATTTGVRPTQILAEPLLDGNMAAAAARSTAGGSTTNRLGGSQRDRWADVGFWVRPDGRVGDIEIVRARGSTDWLAPALTQIGSRLYTRSIAEPGDPGYYMLERFTLTSDWDLSAIGSHMRQRSPVKHIRSLDLTVEQPGR